MSQLEKLIQADAENISNSRDILAQFDLKFPEALDAAAEMFNHFHLCMKGALDDSADLETLNECAKELGVDAEKLYKLIESKTKDSPALGRARIAYCSYIARRVRGIIYLLLERQFMWGATDLLRMRLTPAHGYGRQEAESLALLFIMRDDKNVADCWFEMTTEKKGKEFYRRYQGQIRKKIKRLGLNNAYEMGSWASLHVRFATASRGLSFKFEHSDEIRLSYQELQQNDLFSYFLGVLFFLQTQERVFQALADAFPEVSDPTWTKHVQDFTLTINSLWQRLEKVYPQQCNKSRQMAQAI